MTKMRVHELAKELGMENKELIDLLHKKNVEVSNHMSSIEDNIADEIRKEKNTRSEGKSEGEEAPKKKNLAFVIRPQNSKYRENVRLKSLRVHSRVRVKTRQRQRRRVRHHREHVRKSQVQKSHRLRGRFLLKL